MAVEVCTSLELTVTLIGESGIGPGRDCTGVVTLTNGSGAGMGSTRESKTETQDCSDITLSAVVLNTYQR